MQAAAAGLALIALGTILMVVGPEKPTRAAQRLVGQTVTAGSSLMERKDRLVEDVRILGVVLETAFEGRIEQGQRAGRGLPQAARPPPGRPGRELQKGQRAPRTSPPASPDVSEPGPEPARNSR